MTLIYLIPIILAIAWCIKYDRQEEFDASKSHRFWLLYIILSLITGLSYALGGDKQAYITEFADYSSSFSDILTEIDMGITERGQMPGWVLINMIAKVFFDSFYIVQLIEAFFINYVVFYTCKKYTQHVFMFILLYCITFQYFNFNTEVMREAFSIGFCLIGVEMLFQKRYILTGLLFSLAFLFHVSAIAMVLLFPFMKFKVTKRRFPLILFVALFCWFLSNYLFKFVIDMLLGQEGAFVVKALTYSAFSTSIIAFFVYTIIYIVAPYFIMRLGIEKGIQDDNILQRKEQFLTYFLCIAIIVPSFLPLARFFNYTKPFLLCLTADLLYTLFQEKKGFLVKVPCLFFFWGYTLFQYFAYIPQIGSTSLVMWFPYTSILDEDTSYRSTRQTFHAMILSDEKADENTREVDE